MKKKDYGKHKLLIWLLTLVAGNGFVNAETIDLQMLTSPNAEYCDGLLKLALSYSPENYQFTYDTHPDSVARGIHQLNSGETDVLWTGTTAELEMAMRPIRIPVYRGLLGYRIFMIRDGDQHLFDNIKSLEDLSRFTFGQGTTWPDTAVLKSSGLKVVTTLKYNRLFHMLNGGRFDVFPRGIHEPWEEMKRRPEMELAVEENLLFIYPMPFYFFVSRENAKLQREIEQGLEKAISDGRFEKYFFASPLVSSMLTKANVKNRKAFYLENPTLPPETPLNRKELWLDPLDL